MSFPILRAWHWRLIVPFHPSLGSFIGLDYGKKKRRKKGKERTGSSNYPSRHQRSRLFGAPSLLDLVKLYSSALEDNKTSIRKERIIERRRPPFPLSCSAYPNRISPLFPSLSPLHSWNKLIETHLVREVIFSLSLSLRVAFDRWNLMKTFFPFRSFFFLPIVSSNIAFVWNFDWNTRGRKSWNSVELTAGDSASLKTVKRVRNRQLIESF